MRVWKLLLGLALVGSLLSLAFVQVDVAPLDGHEGAVAYTVPVLNSTIFSLSTSTGLISEGNAGTITDATSSVEVLQHPYIAPVPVKKPLWKVIVGGATLTPIGGIGSGGGTIVGPGTTCTPLDQPVISTTNVVTIAKLEVIEPGGTSTKYTSPEAKYQATINKQKYLCSDGTARTEYRITSETVTYEAGAYYFTKGYGDYQFVLEIHLVAADGTMNRIGATTLDVSVSPTA